MTNFTTYQPYTQVVLFYLGTEFQQKQGEALATRLLRLWDTGLGSILFSEDEVEWLASVSIHLYPH